MFAAVRERLSDTLLRVGAERALERQEMQRSLMASADHNAPGYAGALAAVLTAQVFDKRCCGSAGACSRGTSRRTDQGPVDGEAFRHAEATAVHPARWPHCCS